MDQDTARIGPQELEHESPKHKAPPADFEEKSEEGSPGTLKSSIHNGEWQEKQEKHDLESGQAVHANPAPVKIPRAKRRGLFGSFTIVAEVEEPKNYPRRTKWFITFVIALAAVAAPLGSAIIFRTLKGLPKKLSTNHHRNSTNILKHLSCKFLMISTPHLLSQISQQLATCFRCQYSRSGGLHSRRRLVAARSISHPSCYSCYGTFWPPYQIV